MRKKRRIPEEERLVGGHLGVHEVGRGLDRVGVGNRMGWVGDVVNVVHAAGHQAPVAVAGGDVGWLRGAPLDGRGAGGGAVHGVARGEATVGMVALPPFAGLEAGVAELVG